MAVYLSKSKTGLRWSPTSFASEFSLVQGSDIFPAFAGLELKHYHKNILETVCSWPRKYGALRLGYWRRRHGGDEHPEMSDIIYGLRF
jgi:hypothetical protein